MEQIQRKTRRLELVLGPEDGGVKVDTLLRRRLHLSGTVIRRIKWLPDGILVDGARVNTAFRPREGQTLSVPPVRPGAAQRHPARPGSPGYRVRGRGPADPEQGPRGCRSTPAPDILMIR